MGGRDKDLEARCNVFRNKDEEMERLVAKDCTGDGATSTTTVQFMVGLSSAA